jgi:protein O-mannosyl-transferase
MAVKEERAPAKDSRLPEAGAGPTRVNQGAALSGGAQSLVICLLLTVATLIVYSPVAKYPFINYDDDTYVVDNPHVNTGINWQNVRWASTALAAGNWHPVTWVSHQVDSQLFGLRAGGHHLTNLALHLCNALLLFLLLSRATGARWRSAVVAALFALHPLNVESVAWVAERKNLLCTFFFLLALAAYGWYVRNPQVKRYLCVALLFGLGLASKPMIITFPFILLLVDFWPLGRIEGWGTPSPAFLVKQERFSRLVMEKLPLFALSAASAVITMVAQRSADAVGSVEGWTAMWRLENAIHSYAAYLGKAFFPFGLAPFYPGMVLHTWKVGLALLFLLTLGWLVYRSRSRYPYVLLGSLWFAGMLVPVIGIVQIGSQSMADRYTYIPCVGIFVAVVWSVSDAFAAMKVDRRRLIPTTAILLIALALVSARQLHYWRSSYDLWTRTLQVTVNNFVAEENLGSSLIALGRLDEALPHLLNAEQLGPEVPVVPLNVGSILVNRGRHQEAIEQFEVVVRTTEDPSYLAAAYRGLGVASAQLGDRTKAREYFLQTLRLNPHDSTDLYNLSLLEVEDGIDKMSRSLSAHPTAQGYVQMGQLLQEDHKISDAHDAYEKALRLDPNLGEAKQALLQLKSDRQ